MGGGDGPDDGDQRAVPPPTIDDLLAIPSDAWAGLLRHVRAALHDLDDAHRTPEIDRLRSSPASRLAGGRVRRQLAAVLAAGGPPWHAVHRRLAAADVPDAVAWLVRGEPARRSAPAPTAPPPADPDRRADIERLKERARSLKDERDEARRRAAGAEARAEAVEAKLAELQVELDRERDRVNELEAALREAASERDRAVERERRRLDAELAEVRAELRDLRRSEQQRREARRRADARAADSAAAERAPAPAEPEPRAAPGRPTVLPPTIRRGTAEEVEALLERGRRVIVDGYNVTKQHQDGLSLEQQRAWLIRLLAAVAARRKVRPEVVFDGQVASGGGRAAAARGVAVRFTAPGVSADDDIEFAVAGLDPFEPVLVVTDDRELQQRVARYGADVVGTRPFLWAVG